MVASVSTGIVEGYKGFSFVLKEVDKWFPLSFKNAVSNFAENLKASGVKNFVAKPVILMCKCYELYKAGAEKVPTIRDAGTDVRGLALLSTHAVIIKNFISALEVISALPFLLKSLQEDVASKPIKYYTNSEGERKEAPSVSEAEFVFNKIFQVASWVMAGTEAIKLLNSYIPSNRLSFLVRVTSWVQVMAGGYMAVQGLYGELRLVSQIKFIRNESIHIEQKIDSTIKVLTNCAYIFSTVLAGLSLWYAKPHKWLDAASLAIIALPLIDSVAGLYINRETR